MLSPAWSATVFLEQLRAAKMLYSHARFSTESEGGLTLYPSRPQVLKKDLSPF